MFDVLGTLSPDPWDFSPWARGRIKDKATLDSDNVASCPWADTALGLLPSRALSSAGATSVSNGRTGRKNYPGGWGWKTAAFVIFCAACLVPLLVGGQPSPTADNPVAKGLSRIAGITLPNPHTFTFAVFGDNRGSTEVFERLLTGISDDPDILFAVSTGDIVGIGSRDRFNFFFSQVNRCLTKPLVFAVGNHELLGGGDARYPSVVGSRDYSFVFGDAAFIIVDDTKPDGIDAAGEELLKKELAAADTYGQTFVFMHVPLYDPPGTDIRHSLAPSAAGRLMDLFRGHRITRIFCSHIHGYYQGDWEGIPFTISGGAGAPLIGTDPAHYFNHYLKVRVINGQTTVEPVPVATDTKRG